jgi:serine/threonine-protein kinase
MMAVVALDDFIGYLVRTELLEPVQLEEITYHLKDQHPDPRELARELMRREWLTPYQVNQLALGRGLDLVLEPYILLERLGEGGMGQVFKARHRSLARIVALKVLRRQMLDNHTAVRRFQREVQAVAQMSHPNIVRAYDANDVSGTLYLAMELIVGKDLAQIVRENGPLPVAQACDYIRQAALGLQHAHECGLVHRDIKPANLLVTREKTPSSSAMLVRPGSCLGRWGTVKILDLGLARLKEEDGAPPGTLLTQLNSVMGTPDYIAPEQVRNSHDCDIRADLYSLGCTLYFLLSGRPPFPNGSITEKLLQHQLDEPEPVELARRCRLSGQNLEGPDGRRSLEVPAKVIALVRQLLAKDPQHRSQTPAELADALTQLLCKARPSSLIRRRPLRAALARRRTSPQVCRTVPDQPAPLPGPLVEPPTAPQLASPAVEPTPIKQAEPRKKLRRAFGPSRKFLVYGGFLLVCLLAARAAPSGAPVISAAAPMADPAEADWQALEELGRQPKLEPAELRRHVLAFRRAHPGARVGQTAAMLARLPSPLDRADGTWTPRKERLPWQHKDVVAIFVGRLGPPQVAALAVALDPDCRFIAGAWDDNLVRLRDVEKGAPHPARICRGHVGRVVALAFSPDGGLLASGSHDGNVHVWNPLTGKLHKQLQAHEQPVAAVAFAPDGQALATAGWDGNVKLWDLSSWQPRRVAHDKARVLTLGFSPDSSQLAWGRDDGTLTVAAVASGTFSEPFHHRQKVPVTIAAFTPNGHELALGGGDGRLHLGRWAGSVLRRRAVLVGHSGSIHAATFAPGGRRLATVGEDGRLILWQTASGAKVREWDLGRQLYSVAYASDGRHLVTANSNGLLYVVRLNERR